MSVPISDCSDVKQIRVKIQKCYFRGVYSSHAIIQEHCSEDTPVTVQLKHNRHDRTTTLI